MTTFICLYPNHYGIGTSIEEAQKNARKAGGKKSNWCVIQLPEGATNVSVDDFGFFRWKGPMGATPIVKRGRDYRE